MSTDKRVIKTRKAITTAFMELALEKDISKISVSDLAEKAVINRSTFYLHYADTKEVLDDIENDVSETINDSLSQFDTDNIFESTNKMLMTLTGVLDENPAFKNFMLHSPSSGYIISNIKKTLTAKALEAMLKKSFHTNIKKASVAITYMVSGIIDTYIFWANNEQSNGSLEEFCCFISQLTERVIDFIR